MPCSYGFISEVLPEIHTIKMCDFLKPIIHSQIISKFYFIAGVEAVKVLKVLQSSKAPLVKKRQAMRNTFGDYRAKMKKEQAKSAAGESKGYDGWMTCNFTSF